MKKLKPRIALFDSWDSRILVAPYREMGLEVMLISNIREARTLEFNYLLLGGGSDVNPIYYGEAAIHASVTPTSKDRDRVEWILVRRAFAARIPTLGICRGCQLMAVASGAILAQDLNFMGYTDRDHRRGFHPIEYRNRYLEKIAGDLGSVNTFHHQAISNTPLGWETAATSDDGIIESIYYPGFLGVQWHPERPWTSGKSNRWVQAWDDLTTWHVSGFRKGRS